MLLYIVIICTLLRKRSKSLSSSHCAALARSERCCLCCELSHMEMVKFDKKFAVMAQLDLGALSVVGCNGIAQ